MSVRAAFSLRGRNPDVLTCIANLSETLAENLTIDEADGLCRAATYVLSQNIIRGDALKRRTHDGRPITFAEWGYIGKGKFQRRDFLYNDLSQSSSFGEQDLFLTDRGKHSIFTPIKTYPPITVKELAALDEEPR